MYGLCMFVHYLVSTTQDTSFRLDNLCERGNLLIIVIVYSEI
jgi:hypothetical protein